MGSSAYGAPRQFQLSDFNPKNEWELLGGGCEDSLSFVMGVNLREKPADAVSSTKSADADFKKARSVDASSLRSSLRLSFLLSYLRGEHNASSRNSSIKNDPSAHSSVDLNRVHSKRSSINKSYTYALKIFNKAQLILTDDDPLLALEVMRSMRTLKELSDVNTDNICIVQFYGTMGTKSQICYALEPLLHGSLRRVMKMMDDPKSNFYLMGMKQIDKKNSSPSDDLRNRELSDKERKSITKINHIRFYAGCLAKAVDYMRAYGVAHRDIRPENVLFDANGVPKLIDFSVCKRFPYTSLRTNDSMTKAFTRAGQLDYCAPEFLFTEGHDTGVDLWALGILFYEMLMGPYKTPFRYSHETGNFMTKRMKEFSSSEVAMLEKRIVDTAKFGVHLPHPHLFQEHPLGVRLLDLVSKLLVYEPTNRFPFCSNDASRTLIFDHPFFDDDLADSTTMDNYSKAGISSYEPSFKPSKFNRAVKNEFRMEDLFMRYHGDQKVFIGFR